MGTLTLDRVRVDNGLGISRAGVHTVRKLTVMSQDANDFLMGAGGKSASFKGTAPITVSGVVKQEPTLSQQRDITSGEPKTWNNGDPMMQMVITLQTDERDPSDPDDDGVRVLYVAGDRQRALREAVKRAGAKRVEVGGRITMTYTHDDLTKEVKRGMNPPKKYSATYEPPNPLDAAGLNQPAENPFPAATQAAATPAIAAGPARPANIPEAVWATLDAGTKAALAAAAVPSDEPPF